MTKAMHYRELLTKLFTTHFLGTGLDRWIAAAALAVLVFVILTLVLRLIESRLESIASKTETLVDDILLAALGATLKSCLAVAAVYVGARSLSLPPGIQAGIGRIGVVALLVQILRWGNRAIVAGVDLYIGRQPANEAARATSIRAMGFLGRLVFFSLATLWGLDNLGVNITTLVAGLGVGGIAVALAVQNILGDLFASLTIVLDKPFVIGDSITVGDYSGTIENIGLKTTRVRSVTGEQLIFPNSDLLQSRIRNFKRMHERRVILSVGVNYATPVEKLKALPAAIRKIVEADPRLRFDRAHLKTLGASSIDFEVVYWVRGSEMLLHMDAQQTVQLALIEMIQEWGVDLAFPTQTLHIASVPATNSKIL